MLQAITSKKEQIIANIREYLFCFLFFCILLEHANAVEK